MTSPPRHPFRFGVQISTAPDGDTWRALARRAEELGYDTLSAADHLDDQFAPVPALVAAVKRGGADGVGYFCYDLMTEDMLAILTEP